MKESIRHKAIELGAYRCGFALAQKVSGEAAALYRRWVEAGCHGEMTYCAKYLDERDDPRLLLDGTRTVISCAFPYAGGGGRTDHASLPFGPIASYAYGEDYHYWVKDRLKRLGQWIEETYGGVTRACVDTAPIRERYWAQQAGIGFVGINNQLIIPGAGSRFFLGELLWTGAVDADEPCELTCGNCQACVRACPGSALDGAGGCDARRCVSYLTIEHRGPLPAGANLGGMLYGCDACLDACPHGGQESRGVISETISERMISELSEESELSIFSDNSNNSNNSDNSDIAHMTPSHYRKLVARSAMRRVPLAQLRRNVEWLNSQEAGNDTQ